MLQGSLFRVHWGKGVVRLAHVRWPLVFVVGVASAGALGRREHDLRELGEVVHAGCEQIVRHLKVDDGITYHHVATEGHILDVKIELCHVALLARFGLLCRQFAELADEVLQLALA